MILSNKEKLIDILVSNGYKRQKCAAGVIVYIKKNLKKCVIFSLSQNIFEKKVIQLINNKGSSLEIYRYDEIYNISFY